MEFAPEPQSSLRPDVGVVRCRRNGLANALPLAHPVPVDGLGFVKGCCNPRQFCLNLLPYVGPGWYEGFAGRDAGPGRCHIVLDISARSHVDAAARRWSGNVGSTEVYSVRSSSKLDGAGADFSQAFAYKKAWCGNFVHARRLLSNGTCPMTLSTARWPRPGASLTTWRR